MEKGTVKFFAEEKGFGFITPTSGNDLFFHISNVVDGNYTPKDGDEVEFEIGEGKKGPAAVNIQRA